MKFDHACLHGLLQMNACNESTKVIAPGTARVIELEVRSPSLFKVGIGSATCSGLCVQPQLS